MQIYIFHFYNIILFNLYLVGTTTSGSTTLDGGEAPLPGEAPAPVLKLLVDSTTLDGGAATTGGFKYAFEASTTLDVILKPKVTEKVKFFHIF